MSIVVEQDGYQYASLIAASVFLTPQIYLAYKTKSLKDISTCSLLFILVGSLLWAFYMYETQFIVYSVLTLFVGIQALLLLCMQFYFYYNRVNVHMKSFDVPPTQPSLNLITQPDNSV